MTSAQPTWFALEGQDGLDPRLLVHAHISVCVHQSDVISYFSLLGSREEAAQTDGLIFTCSTETRSINSWTCNP